MNDSYYETQADRLRKARVDAGFETAAEACRRFNWNQPTYTSHENGTRNFRMDSARDYARAYKVDPYWLFDGKILQIKKNKSISAIEELIPTGLIPARIVGYVQAGRFGETNELSVGDEDVMYVSEKFRNAYGLIVKGDSMNLKYAEGTKLICVPILDYEREITPGRSVIVMAKSQADEIETTVKEFYTDTDGNHWLIPRSSNPIYQNYPVPNGEALDVTINGRKIKEITITAIVVSSQQDEE